ncbi:MAG: transcriptional regulator, LuxR family [Conexibacter sp.]|nr:transcriptional regulator, LuxR family [Conexibacter sp.]
MPCVADDSARPLLGRDRETARVASLLDGITTGGAALVLSGEPGIGKSRLLAQAAELAVTRRMTVLATSGAQSEARLPYSGLSRLLRPVRSQVSSLPPTLRSALDVAFGLADDLVPEHFRISMAVLELLSEVAAGTPLLVVVEDAHWLDRASSDVLAFVARRLDADPIVLLAATRDGYPGTLADAGLPELPLSGLAPEDSAQLLAACAPHLNTVTRERVLRDAAGNPLALIELPMAPTRPEPDLTVPSVVPLTDRLERAFASRVSDLPETTRLLLLVAALIDGDDVDEVVRAGSAVSGTAMTIEALAPAVSAALVTLDLQTVRFRHPLMRSAVRQDASVAQQRRVHEALAHTLRGDPDRCVWHRAALIRGEHEDVALELEATAERAVRRGGAGEAFTALRRAAELSDQTQRGRRLLAAAELAYELGQPTAVVPLLREAARLAAGPLDRARATWIGELIDARPLVDTARATMLVSAAESAGAAGDRELHIELLWLVAVRAWWADPGSDARRVLIDAASRLGEGTTPDPRVLAIYAYADPFGHAPAVLERLEAAAADGCLDTDAARYLSEAALVLGAFDHAATFLKAAIDGLRAEGRLGHLPRTLALCGLVAARRADWAVAIPAADESRRLGAEFGEPLAGGRADTVISTMAGMRGDAKLVERAAMQAERVGLATGANATVAFAQFGRVMAALGAGRYADAYGFADRLFDPADPAFHPFIAAWLIGDLAEAAAHAGRVSEARARVAHLEALVGDSPAVWIALGLRHARALLADDEEAAGRFDEALAADLSRWPFQRARLLLAHGQWLRRRRRIAESRPSLRAARDLFDALGCAAWSKRAREDLRASGESSRRSAPEARDELTPQELQIAHLAAEGLSNREIGERLYLSPRTISTHLYRAFPKLGITSRGQLASALELEHGAGGAPQATASA